MKHLLVLMFIFLGTSIFSQTVEDVTYEYKKGKKYIVHFALTGNTLWGLHTTYNVPVDDIVSANPGVEKSIVEGQRIVIPVGAADATYPDGTLLKEHIVVKGETLYNLSKKERVTTDAIVKLNPGADAGLKLGQVIKIPVNNSPVEQAKEVPQPVKTTKTTVSFSDTVISHTVMDHETLYSISKRFMVPVNDLQALNQLKSTKIKPGQQLQIPLKKEKVKQIEIRQVEPLDPTRKGDEALLFKRKHEYRIAIMLPFNLDVSESGAASLREIATEFYMGAELALDSLKDLGLNARVYVYDALNDSLAIVKLLKNPDLKQMDLIFGPLIPQGADIVGRWCRDNKIRMVCPSACNSALLKDNPYVYAAIPSDITQQRIMARFTVENHKSDQIVLVNTGVAKDRELYNAYRERFIELSKTQGNIKLLEIKTEDLAGYIRKNGNTVFVVPTRDKGAAMKFMNTLNKSTAKSGNGTISVFGTKDWASFDDISGFLKNKFNVHWAASSDLNYTLTDTKKLLRNYRTKYKADLSRYGAHGFDVTFYFTRLLLMDKDSGNGVINVFDMEQVSNGNGYENNQCLILRHEEYELVRVATVHE